MSEPRRTIVLIIEEFEDLTASLRSVAAGRQLPADVARAVLALVLTRHPFEPGGLPSLAPPGQTEPETAPRRRWWQR